MRLDPVRDLQRVFRKLMRSMSRPGEIADLSDEAQRLDLPLAINKGMLLVAMTLLDTEVSFGMESGEGAELVSKLTYSRIVPVAEADYVIVLDGGKKAAISIRSAREGTLIDPQLGATLLIEAERVAAGDGLLLSGPGIDGRSSLAIELGPGWIEAREAKNAEYPLGVDLVFVDREYRLAAIPRTTKIVRRA